MFVQDFGVYGFVHAAIFGTELNIMEAAFFPFSVENVGKHLIKLFQKKRLFSIIASLTLPLAVAST